MKIILSLLYITLALTLATIDAHAETMGVFKDAEFDLNLASPGAMQKHQLGTKLVREKIQELKGTYDFSKVGGAVSTINLRGADGKELKLPKNGIIIGCYIDVITTPTGTGSPTIAISSGKAAADIKAATAIASYTGIVACVPVGTAATAIKLTADVTPSVTIATAAVTGGKLNVHFQYIISD